MGELGTDATGDVGGAAEGASCAPAAGCGEGGAGGPDGGERVEEEGAGEGGGEVVGGGGEEEKAAGEGDGLDGEGAGDEGGVAEEEGAERGIGRRREREGTPRGGDGVVGLEVERGGKEGVEGEEGREGGGVEEAAPGARDGEERERVDLRETQLGQVVWESREEIGLLFCCFLFLFVVVLGVVVEGEFSAF